MRHTLLTVVAVVGILGCAVVFSQAPGPRKYLSDEYFRKQKECDARPPYDRSRLLALVVDYGPDLHQAPKPAMWKSQKVFLGHTCFLASIGPVYYTGRGHHEAGYYSLDVQVPVAEDVVNGRARTSSMVLFQRHLSVSELPPRFEDLEIGEVVSYDSAKRIVRFEIGVHRYEYRLPTP
jgi:hypothetical protein